MNHPKIHQPVLGQEVLRYLDPHPGQSYLDVTAGYGGHALLVLEQLGSSGNATLVDRDQNAADHLQRMFGRDKRVSITAQDFESAARQLAQTGRQYDCILADIGVSSPHLDNPDRGFSFMYGGPLDMRMDQRQFLTASTIVNEWPVDELANVLHRYGEMRGSRRLARLIVEARPVSSTTQLATIIQASTKGRLGPRHKAQVFQALRIVVNDELGMLERSLPLWTGLLKPGGRLVVISFHSLEDRIVKQYFSEHGGNRFDSDFLVLTKQPITGAKNEIVLNPRARSAKLRAAAAKK